LTLSNFAVQNGTTYTTTLTAGFLNCIFWGENGIVENEVIVNKQGTDNFIVTFDKCLYKAKNDPANSILIAPIKNQDPLFDSIDVSKRYYDFHITKNNLAPGINKGGATNFLKDLDNNNRNIGLPDLGCYEKQ